MKTKHEFFIKDSRNLDNLETSVDLVVTSPPYPMIEMWDEIFSDMNKDIKNRIRNNNAWDCFELMHKELDKVWYSIDRLMNKNGIICINIGDATRKMGDNFNLFPNHARILETFIDLNYSVLPCILWRKPTNKASKYMGSGMIPPNAYVTLEHEYILILRKGGTRKITGDSKNMRYESSYFWEERNKWFSDFWTDITGESQKIDDLNRDVMASYPFEIPYRLINMYSIQNDTVLDPFVGTGTTSLAALCSARNSIGIDLEEDFIDYSINRLKQNGKSKTNNIKEKRINNHEEFIDNTSKSLNYTSDNYNFDVMTKQEKNMYIPEVSDIKLKQDYIESNYII